MNRNFTLQIYVTVIFSALTSLYCTSQTKEQDSRNKSDNLGSSPTMESQDSTHEPTHSAGQVMADGLVDSSGELENGSTEGAVQTNSEDSMMESPDGRLQQEGPHHSDFTPPNEDEEVADLPVNVTGPYLTGTVACESMESLKETVTRIGCRLIDENSAGRKLDTTEIKAEWDWDFDTSLEQTSVTVTETTEAYDPWHVVYEIKSPSPIAEELISTEFDVGLKKKDESEKVMVPFGNTTGLLKGLIEGKWQAYTDDSNCKLALSLTDPVTGAPTKIYLKVVVEFTSTAHTDTQSYYVNNKCQREPDWLIHFIGDIEVTKFDGTVFDITGEKTGFTATPLTDSGMLYAPSYCAGLSYTLGKPTDIFSCLPEVYRTKYTVLEYNEIGTLYFGKSVESLDGRTVEDRLSIVDRTVIYKRMELDET